MSSTSYPLRARIYRSPLGRRVFGPVAKRRGAGLLVVLLSAISVGVATPFARFAFDAGVDVVALMAVRYGLALLAVVLYLKWRRQPWRLHGRQLRGALGLALALGVVSLAFFVSIRRIPVSLAALIYYSYPIIVSLFGYAAIRSVEQRRAHRLAFGGQTVSFAGLLLVLGMSWGSLDVTGTLLAAISALLIALVYLFGGHLMKSVSPMVLNLHVAFINVILFAGMAVLLNSSAVPDNRMGWVGLFGAVVFFVAGFMGMFAGVSLLGPSQAACLKNVEPIVTVGLAIALLGDSYGVLQLLGVGVVLVGIVTGCHSFWTPATAPGKRRAVAKYGTVDLADCTPLCRLDSRCLLN